MRQWQPTPRGRLIPCHRLEADGWHGCTVEDLRAGDVFQMRWQGANLHPATLDPIANDVVTIALQDAQKCRQTNTGYSVQIGATLPLGEMKRIAH